MLAMNRKRGLASSVLCLGLGLCVASEAAADSVKHMSPELAELKRRRQEYKEHPPTAEQTIAEHEEAIIRYEDQEFKGDNPDGSNTGAYYGWAQRRALAKIRRKSIQDQWGDAVLNRVEGIGELRTHGRLMAELKRVRMMARNRRFPEYVAQIEALMKTENERHLARMQELKDTAGMGAARMAGAQ